MRNTALCLAAVLSACAADSGILVGVARADGARVSGAVAFDSCAGHD